MRTTMQNGSLVKKNEQQETAIKQAEKPKNVRDLLEARMGEIQKVLPSVISPQQFLRLALNALQNTPHLMECTMPSFYGAIMQCAQLGLKPNVNGEAYLIPFKNNKKGGVYECQFIVGYKGLMILARRSGEVANIDAQTVYANDEFDLAYGFEPVLVHKPYLKGDRGEPVGFYATVLLKDGGKSAHYMTVADAQRYGKRYSKAYNNSPWVTDFEAMAKKSCLRQVLKYAPMSTDVDRAIDADNHVLKFEENSAIDSSFVEIVQDEEPTPEEIAEAAADIQADADGVVLEGVPAEDKPKRGRPVREESPQEA